MESHAFLATKHANVTTDHVNTYRIFCKKCCLKKAKARRGVVVKLILTQNVMSRGQVDLIDMQSQPDGGFKFLFKICVLMPLKFKTACAVAKILVDILSLMGPPSILQYDNGHEFKTQEIKNEVLKMWPGLRMVNGKPRHSQSQGSV